MRVAVVGAGAVGGYFGSQFLRAGFDVDFYARGKHLEALRRHGLVLLEGGKKTLFKVKAYDKPPKDAVADLILFTVKGYNTDSALKKYRSVASPSSIVLSLQNGFGNREKIANKWGHPERIVPAMTRIGVEVTHPGTITYSGLGIIYFGAETPKQKKAAETIKQILEAAEISFSFERDIRRILWRKFMWNVAFNTVSAVTESTMGEMLSDPAVRRLLEDVTKEAAAVGRAEGVKITDADVLGVVGPRPKFSAFRTSMLQDYLAGKPLETETLSGALIRKARARKISAPKTEALHAILTHKTALRKGSSSR
ncbi:Ketopantoate reductase PanE/ApbA [uncultured archaeon]|nr:Ketopantoate reductase PanE/ApbA [uncultured archaeon]